MPRTKIVCTIGPASRSPVVLESLIRAGMNVARLNFSHGTRAEHGEVIAAIRQIAERLGRPIAILQDLAGLKIRIGQIASEPIMLESGAQFILTNRQVPGDKHAVSISYPALTKDVQSGDTLLLSDGALALEVLETTRQDIRCRVIIGGSLSSHKGINLPTRSVQAPSLTDKDKEDLTFGIEQGVDYVALSFIRTASDVLEAKRFMQERGSIIPLIAKIEKHEALKNIDEIMPVVDGIMVARGDLGVETPLSKVSLIQKQLIAKANQAGKPVITATQMLYSMVNNPHPTRAEVGDVTNAVLDGTDAVMLSEETTIGKYPIEAVQMMVQIVKDAEAAFSFDTWIQRFKIKRGQPLPEAVANAVCRLAEDTDVKAIITCTQAGSTARLIAKYRPRQFILAPTPDKKTYRHLALIWGVIPLYSEGASDIERMITNAFQATLQSECVQQGEKVVVTAGIPVGVSGMTNLN